MVFVEPDLRLVEAQRNNLARLCDENLVGVLDPKPRIGSEPLKPPRYFVVGGLLRSVVVMA